MMMMFLQGCAGTKIVNSCPVNAIDAPDTVIAWLSSKRPWPDDVRAYLVNMGNQQEILRRSCGRK